MNKGDILKIQRGTKGSGDDIITNGLEVTLPDDLKLKQIRMKKLERFWVVPNEAAVTTKSVALKTHYRMENCLN